MYWASSRRAAIPPCGASTNLCIGAHASCVRGAGIFARALEHRQDAGVPRIQERTHPDIQECTHPACGARASLPAL
jgi:hypothetical protein